MKKYSLLLLMILPLFLKAQTPDFMWGTTMESSLYNCQSLAVSADTAGNTYVAGYFGSSADFDMIGTYTVTSTGLWDFFVAKYSPVGNLLWVKNIGGGTGYFTAYGIEVDEMGNSYTVGEFEGSADFDPGAGTAVLTTVGYRDIFALKLDASGNYVWARRAGGLTGSSVNGAQGVELDVAGNVIVTGYFRGTVDFDPSASVDNLIGVNDVFIWKLDSSGNYVWAKQFAATSTGYNMSFGIASDASGNIYTTGLFADSLDFDPGPAVAKLTTGGATQDAFISKLDASGNYLWAKKVSGPLSEDAYAIDLDAAGNVFITGSFQGTADFDPGVGVSSMVASGMDIFVLKLDPSGNYITAKKVGGASTDRGLSLAVNGSGEVWMTGVFTGSVDFNPGVGTVTLTSGYQDGYVLKLDNSLNYLWAGQMGGSATTSVMARRITTVEKNIYVAGFYDGAPALDPVSSGYFGSPSPSNSSGYALRLSDPVLVWPGDTDNNKHVDNNDLLPIGIAFGQNGYPRASVSNSWLGYTCLNWGTLQINGADRKHVDCNGNGTIDDNDTLAINLNFSSSHAFAPPISDQRMSGSDLYFVTSSSSYLSGSMVDVEIWLGNSTTPVTDLYGIAFDVNYDASLVQPASESLTYPASWLGTPGTDAITIAKIDALSNAAYGAETRIDHVNTSGFGKIADFKFQLKTSIPANTVMYFSISGYSANDAAGASISFNTPLDSILINPTSVAVNEVSNETQISIYPNPTSGTFNIFTSEQIKNGSIEIYNVVGGLIFSQKIINQQNTIDLKNQASGLYFVKVISDGEVVGMKKVVKE